MSTSFIFSLLPFILLGFLPSTVWLLFYLRKDSHPESNPMILKVFFYGILAAVPAFFIETSIELGIFPILSFMPKFLIWILDYLIVIGFTEEILKYAPFRIGVLKNAQLDEPVDITLYLIISALGFAAAENILVFLSHYPDFLEAGRTAIFRLLTGTLLHALASGTLGYFIALAFFNTKMRKRLLFTGFSLVIVLHALYDFFIIEGGSLLLRTIPPFIILVTFGVFLSFIAFPHLKTIKGICLLQKK